MDLRNQREDFVVWSLVRFTLARRSAVKIFRTLSLIVNSLQNLQKELKHILLGVFDVFQLFSHVAN